MKIALFVILLTACLSLSATWQVRDRVNIGGKEFSTFDRPLWPYLWTTGKSGYFESESSACWRGYQGFWEIVDNKLFLLEIKHCHSAETYNLADLFDGPVKAPIFATWFSGYITILTGKLLYSDNSSYRDYYSSYTLCQVDSGVVVRSLVIDQTQEFIKDILFSEAIVIPRVTFTGVPIENTLHALYELTVEYAMLDEELAEAIKENPVIIEVDESLQGELVDVKCVNMNTYQLLNIITDSIGATYTFTKSEAGLVMHVEPMEE